MVKNKLNEILEDRGIKKAWLANKCGLDRSTLSSVIGNKKSTNLESALRIAKALNLKVEDIFELDDDTY